MVRKTAEELGIFYFCKRFAWSYDVYHRLASHLEVDAATALCIKQDTRFDGIRFTTETLLLKITEYTAIEEFRQMLYKAMKEMQQESSYSKFLDTSEGRPLKPCVDVDML